MHRSIAALTLFLTGMLYAVICQAQILGTSQLNSARRSHTATLLQDGKILIVGGDAATGLVGQAEIFDPASLTSSNIAANPIALRTDHTATLLADGRVLIIGGVDGNGSLASTEFYNPYSVPAPSFSAGPPLQRTRSGHTSTVLANGKILIIGGDASGSAEIYDPATEAFSLVSGSLNTPRQYHSAVLLNSGKVLIAGGVVGANTVLSSAEIYDPQTQSFTPASGVMQTPRGLALLRVLPDGKVQVIGGDGEFSMEMFDPAATSFIALAHIPPHDDYLNSILLSRTRSALITTIIQQNPVLQGKPELTPEIIALLNRLDHTVTEIPQSNRALIAGGVNDAGQILNSATLVSSSAATVTTDRFDYAPGEMVTITGREFQPNETVWMLLHEEPETHDDVITSSVADNQGNFTNTDFAPALIDLNRNFTLTAIGQSSGFTAQTAFKDTSNQITGIRFDPNQPASFTVGVPNPASTPLGVQTINSSNNPETVTGNASVTIQITSSSPTGRFDTNSGGTFAASSLTLTISQNNTSLTANFFYRDTTAGNVTLTATVTARTGQVPAALVGATATLAKTVNKANTTTTITSGTPNPSIVAQPYTVNFTVVHATGGAGTPTGNVTVSDGTNSCIGTVTAGSCALTSTTAGSKTLVATYAGDSNFNGSASAGVSHTVDKADTTTTAVNQTATFSAADQTVILTATVTANSPSTATVNQGTVTFTVKQGATVIGSPVTSATITTGSASANFTLPGATTAGTYTIESAYSGGTNFKVSSDNTKTLTVQKADTITTAVNASATYSNGDQTVLLNATVTSTAGAVNQGTVTFTIKTLDGLTTIGTPVTSATVSGGNASVTFTLPANTAAGDYKIEAVYSGGGNFNGSGDTTKKLTVNRAATTTTVTVADATYDGSPHGGGASVTGPGLSQALPVSYTGIGGTVYGPSTTPPTNAGTYSASASYAESANYLGSSDSKNFTINKATPVVTVSGGPFTYDGTPHAATVTIIGVGGVPVIGSTILNYAGIPPTNYGPITTAPTDAGTYQVRAAFTSTDNNYNNAQGSGSITINKAASVTTVTVPGGESFTYDGNGHPATVSVTGVGGLSLTPAPTYSCAHAPINVADSGCTASYTYSGDVNHLGSSDSKTYTISKASPIVTVTGGAFTYDGNPHEASVSVTGIGGVVFVPGSATLTYAGIPPTSYGPSSTAPTNAGSYQVRSVFTSSDTNYNNAQGTGSITINKADSTTTLSGTGTFTYNGLAHTATATVTGAGGLNQSIPVSYSGNCSAAPVNVNESPCTVSATYGGDANHNGSSANGMIIITKADASITVNGYTGVYDGFAHGATGSAAGVNGENLNASLNLGTTFINVPGGTALWTFSGGFNYNDANGSVAITIAKADPIVTAAGNTCTYNGNPCAGSGSATGVNGESLTPVMLAYATTPGPGNLLASAPVNAGTYHVAARYAGDLNYNQKQSAPATITILQAAQTITVTQEPPASAYYNQTFTVAATASSGLVVSIGSSGSCSGSGTSSALITMTAGSGICAISFDQSGDANYQAAAQVMRNVTALNTAPVAQGQSVATSEDVPVDVILSGSDIDNGSLAFSIVNPPAHGSLGSVGSPSCVPNGIGASCTATVTYSPAPDYNGSDSFSFKINDGSADSNIAIVSITDNPVNDAPTANAQTVTANSGAPKSIDLTGNDIETQGANLIFKIAALPTHGSLTDWQNNILTTSSTLTGSPATVIYTPDLSYEGPDSFTFTVTDRGDPDNCGAPSASCDDKKTSPAATVAISVTDATAPDTTITDKPALLSNNPNPSFSFTGTDNVTPAGDLAFECKLDSGSFLACASPVNYTGLADGAHTFQVHAKDTFGNLDGTEASYSWTIDATPPDTVIDSAPSALTNVATATFTFHSTENNSTFVCTVDGSPVACGAGTFTTASLADGAHTFTVAAVDQAGNLDPTAASVMWTIDTLAPHTAINNGPSNPTTGTSATFAFSSANSPGDTFECRLDGVPAGFAPCRSPVTYTSLSVGNHAFEVRGKDAIGNMETTPASYSWTIGAVTIENYTMDSDFKRFDGFDVVFSKGSGSYLKINSTNPDSFHYQIKLTNNTGIPIGAAHGNDATAIITVPGMPVSCGGVPCSSLIGSLGDPAFVLKGRKVAHVWPGYHDRDDDDDDDDMPVSVKYMTLAQYQANGNSCADNSGYSSTLPSNGAPKCLKISGFTIPVRHAARIRLNFHFRLKGTDGWNANSQQLFYAGFVFRAATSVNFGSNIQTIYDAAGLVGAGKKATAVGGYVFDGATPGAGYMVRLFTKRSDASCTVDTKLVAQSQVDSNGFYYIWRSGLNQSSSTAPSLPSGVQYAVQLCNSSTQIGLKTTDNRLRDKELEQVDFNP